MATYKKSYEVDRDGQTDDDLIEHFILQEHNIYGSSRLGIKSHDENLLTRQITVNSYSGNEFNSITETSSTPATEEDLGFNTRRVGTRLYELANHLGNVLAVITDQKIQVDDLEYDNVGGGTHYYDYNTTLELFFYDPTGSSDYQVIAGSDGIVDYYLPNVVTFSDYYPYGMQMTGRNGHSTDYRYGFNGMEKDNEVKGNGNSYTTEFRQYDPRLGRWLSIDPVTHHHFSPYSAFDNNPIYYADPSGADSEDKGGSRGERRRAERFAKKNDIGKDDYSIKDGVMEWFTVGESEGNNVMPSANKNTHNVSKGFFGNLWSGYKEWATSAENWGKWDNHSHENGWELETTGRTELPDYNSVMFTDGEVEKKNIDWVFDMNTVIDYMGRYKYAKEFLKGKKVLTHPDQNTNMRDGRDNYRNKVKNLDHNRAVLNNYKNLSKNILEDWVSGQIVPSPDESKPALQNGSSDSIEVIVYGNNHNVIYMQHIDSVGDGGNIKSGVNATYKKKVSK